MARRGRLQVLLGNPFSVLPIDSDRWSWSFGRCPTCQHPGWRGHSYICSSAGVRLRFKASSAISRVGQDFFGKPHRIRHLGHLRTRLPRCWKNASSFRRFLCLLGRKRGLEGLVGTGPAEAASSLHRRSSARAEIRAFAAMAGSTVRLNSSYCCCRATA